MPLVKMAPVFGFVLIALCVIISPAFSAIAISNVDPEVVPTETYIHAAEMDSQGKYFLYWKYDAETITFEAWVKTKGWIGLGFSPNGGMAGADVIMGWIDNGQVELSDRHALGNQMPLVDTMQNVELIEGKETASFTMIKFKRKLVTCDVDDRSIEEGTVRVIFSWGTSDPVDENSVSYHGATRRGSRSLLLLDFGTPDTSTDPRYNNLPFFDMQVHNVSLSSQRTTYWCRVHEIPITGKKHHIIKVEPLIEKANLGVVHHIVLYFCHGNLKSEIEGRECWEGNMPENATKCDTIAYAWAVGQGTFFYPEDAGLSIGDTSDPKFLHIEMHYDNPEGLSNVVDSSGLRMYYTDNLHKYDTGTMVIGTTLWFPPMIIPPKADAFQVDAYCSSKCTSKLPTGGINVFAVLLHTHLVGKAVWTRHIRNGKELPELGREDHYDFNYQQLRRFPKPVNIQPGDDLITSCVYKTTGRANMTYGGAGSDNEMCFNFMLYYPKQSVQACTSSAQHFYPIHQMVMEKAMTGELHVDPKTTDLNDVYNLLDKLDWNEKNLVHFQKQLEHTHGYSESCSVSKEGFGVFTGGNSFYSPLIDVKEPLVKNAKCDVMSGATTIHFTSLLLTLALIIVTLA